MNAIPAPKADIIEKEMYRRWQSFEKNPDGFKVISSPQIPDGSPIGMNCSF